MKSVTVKNYRCFGEEQRARLAPLTLLVGENSTGKTSFLAMLRALWQVAFESIVPDFQQPPYDLGTFGEIAHNRSRSRAKSADSARGGGRDYFEASFERSVRVSPSGGSGRPVTAAVRGGGRETVTFEVTFEPRDGVPYPTTRRLTGEYGMIEAGEESIRLAVSDREARMRQPRPSLPDDNRLVPLTVLAGPRSWVDWPEDSQGPNGDNSSGSLNRDDMRLVYDLAGSLRFVQGRRGRRDNSPFAGAPVRSTPRRTYDPSRPFQDPGGEYIPTLLANMSRRDPDGWERLKKALEEFGQSSGLFDEISIESLGKTEGSPFQLHVRKSAGRSKGLRRNLIDVGYGVSQALPILTELLREEQPPMFLLQQPEVHLHPKAQAALGSLFCSIASWDRQIIVETHSDYILDRVRMDIRDGKTDLKAEDVSTLYFEPVGHEVKIHSLALDEQGNVLNAPQSYGRFFMEEVRRSIGL